MSQPLGGINSEHTRSRRSFSNLTRMEGKTEVQGQVMSTGKPWLPNVEWQDMLAVQNLVMAPPG